MKKNKFLTTMIVIIIAALSVAGGFIYTDLADKVRKEEYPLKYKDEILAAAAEENLTPEALFALIKIRSDFNQTAESEGRVGLCMFSEEEYVSFASLCGENQDPRLRWNPDVNIKLGAVMLSEYYEKYSEWPAVFAAVKSGTDAADAAFSEGKTDTALLDKDTRAFVELAMKAMEKYQTLYSVGSSAQSAK